MKPIFTLSLFIFCCFLSAQNQIGANIDGEIDFDEFGTSVSLSSDGSIVAIGSPFHDGKGYVRVFENQSGTWTQIGADIEGEAANDNFGISVSLSADGTIVAVGADGNDAVSGNNNGHVRVYENQSGTWTKIGDDIDGEAENDGSGYKVSLSADGTIVAISAKANDGNGNLSGHVRVYENQSGTWTKLGNDIDGENAGDQFGESLDISSNGTIVAVGSVFNGSFAGHVQVFQYNGVDTWNQIGTDIDGATTGEQSGTSVSLSADGNIVAIGAPLQPNFSRGTVRVYENQSGTWTQIGSDIIGDNFFGLGDSVSLSDNGRIVVIGGTPQNGRVVVYTNVLGSWSKVGNTLDGDSSGDLFGGAVDVSSDGLTVVSGAKRDDNSGNNTGSVSVYDFSVVLSNTDYSIVENSVIIPNPVHTNFSIILQNNQELLNVELYNNLGKKVKTFKSVDINISSVSSGIYFLHVQTNKGKIIKKLVIE
ncbi:T9SS type A sorting domain-containing protein [Seonamhaeicola sp. ML3]|uniref:T9SS type A sorting domain-containing protein n=1 Tax=Seonamhaeicola sp. ML3 TaxID=2937786 RepID=UPI00200C882B|nr:T9SS type A sorting domain-containing protein [Seonamhaeicola sp. ML3]